MASFTDEIQQFNPYIQQIPVEEYTRAGMIRQQQYDQGVQKVQGYIDSVAGLPIAGEANKKLLNDKLGELRGKMQGILSADFSKASLQNQVAGFASQIAKDPAIRNSIAAAASIEAWKKSVEEAKKKDGKGYSAANIWIGERAIAEYLQASESQAGIEWSGPTSIHHVTEADVIKKVTEGIQQMKGFENAEVSIGHQGNVEIKSTNKSLDKSRIKTIIDGLLDSDDKLALQYAGMYQMKDLDDATVLSTIKHHWGQVSKQFKYDADSYDRIMNTTANLSLQDKEYYKTLKENAIEQKTQYDNYVASIEKAYNEGNFNRDYFIGQLWADKLQEQFSRGMSFEQKDKETKIDPQSAYNVDLLSAQNSGKDTEGASIPSGIQTPLTTDPDESSEYLNNKIIQGNLNQNATVDIDRDDAELRDIAKEIVQISNGEKEYVDGKGEWKGKDEKEKLRNKKEVEEIVNKAIVAWQSAVANGSNNVPEGMNQTILNRLGKILERTNRKNAWNNLDSEIGNAATKIANSTDENIEDILRSTLDNFVEMGLVIGDDFIKDMKDIFQKGNTKEEKRKFKDKKEEFNARVDRIKNRLLKEKEKAINPMFVTFDLPSSKRDSSEEYRKYANVIQMSDEIKQLQKDGFIVSDTKDIDIIGGYYDTNNRFKIRATIPVEDEDGKKKGRKTIDVDATSAADFLKIQPGSQDYWTNRNFTQDSEAGLTALAKAGYSTQSTFVVTSNLKANRQYKVVTVPANPTAGRPQTTFKVVILRPEKGKVNFELKGEFATIGSAKEAAERLYGDAAARGISASEVEEAYINATKQ